MAAGALLVLVTTATAVAASTPAVDGRSAAPAAALMLRAQAHLPIVPMTSPESGAARAADSLGQQIAQEARKLVGLTYQLGGSGPDAFDCSGLTHFVYAKFGLELPRTTTGQFQRGAPVAVDRSRPDDPQTGLKPGDLVFFAGTWSSGLSHVAIYLGNRRMVHAQSERTGVTISDPFDTYWGAHYAGARRAWQA